MLTVDNLKIPKSWEIWGGADTGTFMGGSICAIDPNFEMYVLEEFPNYRYTGDGKIELIGMTVSEWIKWYALRMRHWTGDRRNSAWVDANTTFKTEVGHGLTFRMNRKSLELRTEITREYNRHGRIHLMPWLTIIPKEMEEARFPEQETTGGVYRRVKQRDHCLDGVEHVCSRRPHPDFEQAAERKVHGIDRLVAQHREARSVTAPQHDPHLGAL